MSLNLKKTSEKLKLVFWTACSITIGIFLASLLLSLLNARNNNTLTSQNNTSAQTNTATVIQSLEEIQKKRETISAKKSQYYYINKDENGQPKLSAKAFLVGDLNTGEVILSEGQDEKYPIASVSKLMTALVASLIMEEGDIAEVSKQALATQGSNGELKLGQKIKTADLLYPLLLESSNDAAEVIAEHFTRDNFIAKMNQEANTLKMTSTSYEDPSGLSPNNKSTVSDMFKLVGYLNKQKKDLLEITGKRSYSNKKQSWSNISQFLGEDGYLGGKSGYTDRAKQTVVSVFNLPLSKTGYRPIAITLLQSSDRKKDVETILKYLKKNIYYGGLADANTDWIQEKVGMPNIKDPNYVTLALTGDIMLDRGVKNSVRKNFNNDYSKLFEKSDLIKILKKSDIVFGTLEGPVSDKGTDLKNLYSFRMDGEVIPALKGAGMDVLSVANNHIGDYGRLAFMDTLSRLNENEILYTGGGNNKKEAETPVIIEKYGIKIGFLAFSDKGPDYIIAKEDNSGILLTSDPNFDEIIKNASRQVDYLVVSFHFGEEYQAKHDERQESLAHKAVDDGAKIVVGSHPHVIEDTEVYSRKDCTQSSCMSFIAYSLGNFVFDQSWSKDTMKGMLLEIKLGIDGSIAVRKDTTQLNSVFQIEKVSQGSEEKIKFK